MADETSNPPNSSWKKLELAQTIYEKYERLFLTDAEELSIQVQLGNNGKNAKYLKILNIPQYK